MLLEPYRSRYLRALGVEVYVPRHPLPGAAIAQPVGWIDEGGVAKPDFLAPPLQHFSANIDATDGERNESRREITAVGRSALPELDANARSSSQNDEGAGQPVAFTDGRRGLAAKSEASRFSLLISRCETGLVVVDEGTRADRRRDDYLRLLNSVLFALYRRPVAVESDLFVWPMVKNPLVDHGEQAARESLGAYLQRQCSLVNSRRLVVLGAGASQWMNEDPAFSIVAGISLWRCFSDNGAKQTLWQQLQPLRMLSN